MEYTISEERMAQMIRNETAIHCIDMYVKACEQNKTHPTVESMKALLGGLNDDTGRTGSDAGN